MSETPQGYSGPLPPNYVQSSAPQTPNLGLTLSSVDPIMAYNLVLIDTAVGSGGGGGSPGGNIGDVQFKAGASTFGGSDNLFWDDIGQTLEIDTAGFGLSILADNAGASTTLIPLDLEVNTSIGGTNTITGANISILNGSGVTSSVKGMQISVTNAGGGTLNFYRGILISGPNGSIGTAKGIQIGSFSNGGDTSSRALEIDGGIVEFADGSCTFALGSNPVVSANDLTTGFNFIYSGITPGNIWEIRIPDADSATAVSAPAQGGKALSAFDATTGLFSYVSVGSGTVTSVALATGAGASDVLYTITGSPVTTSGTITETLRTQSANLVFSGPTTGAAASPTFRSLVTADMPAGTGTVTSVTFTGDGTVLSSTPSSAVTTTGTLTAALANAAGGTVLGRNATTSGAPSYTIAPVLGIPGTSTGTIALASVTASGKFTLTAPSSAATPTLTLPTTSNVLAGQFAGDGVVLSSTLATASAAGTVTAALANAGGGTVLGNATTGSAAPTYTTAPVLGIPGTSTGTIALASSTASGKYTITAPANAATPTLTLPTGTGTFAVTASSPIVLDATTGNLTGPTIVTSASSLTNNAVVLGAGSQGSKTAAGFTTDGTSALTLGVASTGTGSLVLAGTTSGSVTLTTTATGTLFSSNAGLAFSGASGAATTISTTTTNANLILTPNGTGSVVVPAGAGATPGLLLGSGGPGLWQVTANIVGLNTGSSTVGGFRLYNGTTALTSMNVGSSSDYILQCGVVGAKLVLAGLITTQAGPAILIGADGFGTGNFTSTSTGQTGVAFGNGATGNTGGLVFAPTSGTATFNAVVITPQINQTGGANGTVTDLLLSATETALVGTHNALDIGTGGTGGKFTLTAAGVATKYANTTLVGQGVPSEIVTIDLTAQTAAITATNLTASAPRTGMYRISMSATITTAGTSSILGGTNGFQISFTSPTDSVAKTTVAGNSITSAANTTGTAIADTLTVYAKTGTAISYTFDYTSTGTAMTYELHLRLEAL